MRATRMLLPTGLATAALLAGTGPAVAQPITFTETETTSETFADEPFLCQDELYVQSGEGHLLVHLTAQTDEEGNPVPPFHFHLTEHAVVIAAPLDGTGPTYVAHLFFSDSESIRSVKNGTVDVETDTDLNHVVAKGSDGSMVFLQEHHHFTVTANGDVSVQFDQLITRC